MWLSRIKHTFGRFDDIKKKSYKPIFVNYRWERNKKSQCGEPEIVNLRVSENNQAEKAHFRG